MIYTDGKPTIAMRGSLPEERKKAAKRRKFRELEEQRQIDREVARLVTTKVLV